MDSTELKLITPSFNLEVKSGSGDEMVIAGYASTSDLDYVGDSVLPSAFSKTLSRYQTKGRYWFNHNANMPVGKVVECHTDSKGLYLDEARLAETKFNREWLWPLVKEGALNEHSIQFLSKAPKTEGGVRYHVEVELLETSIVSLACNPGAIITDIKALMPAEEYYAMMDNNTTGIEQLAKIFELHLSNQLQSPSEIKSTFVVDGLKDSSMNLPDTKPQIDFMDISLTTKELELDVDGETTRIPSKHNKNYDKICSSLYLAKSVSRNAYLFQVAVPTEKGFKYDFDLVAISLASVLGAKGGILMSTEQKGSLIKELISVYETLGKTLPTYDTEPISELSEEVLTTLKFSDLVFSENEKEIFSLNIAKNAAETLTNTVKHFGDNLPDDLVSILKSAWASISFCVYIYPDDEKDLKFLNALVDAYAAYKAKEDSEDGLMLSSFGKYLIEQEAKTEELPAVEETLAEPKEESLEESFAKALENF